MSPPAGTHYVYRLFDDEGSCLYVGCSIQPAQRMVAHSGKAWGSRIDFSRTIIEKREGYYEGRARESELILRLQPEFNEAGTADYRSGVRKSPKTLLAVDTPAIRFENRAVVHWARLHLGRAVSAACGADSQWQIIQVGSAEHVTCQRCLSAFEVAAEPAA